jgi:fructokinase
LVKKEGGFLIGGIEAGGTKYVCAVADDHFNIVERITIPSADPEKALKHSIEFFQEYKIDKLGIGTFGPVDINPKSNSYGTIQNTPKIKWQNVNLYQIYKEALGVPVTIDTDVNAAALGEYHSGFGIGKKSVLYITIGTGVGAGLVVNGKTFNGLTHPEMGHISIRQREDDNFEGVCPFHQSCLEGLVSGPAIEKRMGIQGQLIEEDAYVWDLNAEYIGQALANYNLILSPEIILIGGGVSKQEHMFPKIRAAFKKYLNGYIVHERLEKLDEYIKYPKLGQDAGLIGSLYL